MKFTSGIKEIKFEIDKSRIIGGTIIFSNHRKIVLKGKPERINGIEFVDYKSYFIKPDFEEKNKILPIKLIANLGKTNKMEKCVSEAISDIISFWEDGATVLSIKVTAFDNTLCGEILGILGKSYSDYAKYCEFSFEFNINSGSTTIIEAKNISGLKDVPRKGDNK